MCTTIQDAATGRLAATNEAARRRAGHGARILEVLSPNPAVLDAVEALRGHGLDDRTIHDAVQVIADFNDIDRVPDGLGCNLEEWMSPPAP